MDAIGIRELRQNASKYIERVAAGESIDVTRRGVPVARIVPVDRPKSIKDLRRLGLVIPAKRAPKSVVRAKPKLGQKLPSEYILEERESGL